MGDNRAVMVVMEGEEEDGKRARSFRDEDYNNRRVFLRSYPLYVEVNTKDDDEEEDVNHLAIVVYGSTTDVVKNQEKENEESKKESVKKILKVKKINNVIKNRVYRVLRWGERKVLHINKFSKRNLSFCLVACHPFRFSKHHSCSSSSPSCLF